MSDERIVFDHTFDGLFHKALRGQVTPKLKQRLLVEAHLNLDRLLPGYSIDDWARAVQITADELYPKLPVEEAYTEIGKQVIGGYFETLIGKALSAMVRVLGAERTLRRLERSMRGANNYTTVTVNKNSPGNFTVVVNEPNLTRYVLRGILYGGISAAGAKNLKVEMTKVEGDLSTCEVTWDE
jgi:uncharacterized protein (TIGR02265 family)